MSSLTIDPAVTTRHSALRFGVITLSVIAISAALAGGFPLGFSIVTVFLFAGPHNWMEARYFLERMPPRWGRLKSYFLTGLAGIVLLCASFALLPWLGEWFSWSHEGWLIASACWNTGLLLWILVLIQMRSRQTPVRNWEWTWPLGFLLVAAAWLWPTEWGLALVYLHPLVALWFLDRELRKYDPRYRRIYRSCLSVVAFVILGLGWLLASAPNLPGEDALTLRISQHAGASVLQGVSTHCLVAWHTFLEMLHYGVWLVAMPALGFRAPAWNLKSIPLSRRSARWKWAIIGILCLGGSFVLILWAGFLANYPLTRDIYFTVALIHVLTEIPFLLRTL